MKDNALRKTVILQNLPLQLPGLEISPLFRPATDKALHNVCYTDYTSAEDSRQKHAHYEHDDIVDIDFIWHPHATLESCVPGHQRFDWAVASHVLEHVPDPLGWILEVLAVLNDGAIFSLVLPNKRYCFDRFRQTSSVAQWLQWWLTRQRIPAPQQLYDFLRNCTSDDGEMYQRLKDLTPEAYQNTRCPHYTQQQALEFVLNAWTTGHYFDAHCSVFTPESAAALLAEVVELGILNVAVSASSTRMNFTSNSPSWASPRSLIPVRAHHERQLATRSFHVARSFPLTAGARAAASVGRAFGSPRAETGLLLIPPSAASRSRASVIFIPRRSKKGPRSFPPSPSAASGARDGSVFTRVCRS